MQRLQSKLLRATANAPWYVTNHNLHTDFNIPYVSDVIHERINKHYNKLGAHPSPLLEPLMQPVNTRRLKRCWPLDFQGTWGDIAGRISYRVTAIHSIVVYFCNQHVSLWTVLFLVANKNIKKICVCGTILLQAARCLGTPSLFLI